MSIEIWPTTTAEAIISSAKNTRLYSTRSRTASRKVFLATITIRAHFPLTSIAAACARSFPTSSMKKSSSVGLICVTEMILAPAPRSSSSAEYSSSLAHAHSVIRAGLRGFRANLLRERGIFSQLENNFHAGGFHSDDGTRRARRHAIFRRQSPPRGRIAFPHPTKYASKIGSFCRRFSVPE